jgi:hypothetical protein
LLSLERQSKVGQQQASGNGYSPSSGNLTLSQERVRAWKTSKARQHL